MFPILYSRTFSCQYLIKSTLHEGKKYSTLQKHKHFSLLYRAEALKYLFTSQSIKLQGIKMKFKKYTRVVQNYISVSQYGPLNFKHYFLFFRTR